ncbi:MAG: hypothetical protein QGH39_05080 [Candidatus Thermoplasmatota archaeon]|jgi:hypothetical protein|nr:hypothetical protein [Candidatus Thermoplasmatota archaeon]MDP7264918.1 hypothetical protein [Candidatus Thermoplasmatota archaeon]
MVELGGFSELTELSVIDDEGKDTDDSDFSSSTGNDSESDTYNF